MTRVIHEAVLTRAVSASDHAQGPPDAPVVLVEYGDYECSYCGAAFPIVHGVQRQMGKALRFVFRNFPLKESHPHALHAAIAAEVVGAHGEPKFWAMHDVLYTHQDALDDADLVRYAEALGVPAAEIQRAFQGEAGPAAARVLDDFNSGIRSGVNGTPTFFINGARFDGNWTDREALLDALRTSVKAAQQTG